MITHDQEDMSSNDTGLSHPSSIQPLPIYSIHPDHEPIYETTMTVLAAKKEKQV